MTAAMEGEPDHKAEDVLYRHLLEIMGLASHVDDQTATRYVRALRQLTSGTRVDPTRHLQVTFPPVTTQPTLVTVTDIPYVSLCSHHMLPFWGTATVGYLPQPGAKIVGLSKIARCFRELAARPQIQEQLGQQMIDVLCENLDCAGAAIAIRGTHTCMALRGAATGTGAAMVTTTLVGSLGDEPWLGQFLAVSQSVMHQ
jgi:GTP cyclohydrolase IA